MGKAACWPGFLVRLEAEELWYDEPIWSMLSSFLTNESSIWVSVVKTNRVYRAVLKTSQDLQPALYGCPSNFPT